jgi:hypothetical protein
MAYPEELKEAYDKDITKLHDEIESAIEAYIRKETLVADSHDSVSVGYMHRIKAEAGKEILALLAGSLKG